MTYPTATCHNTACTVVTYAYREEGRDTVPECPGCSLLALTTALTDAAGQAVTERDQLRAEVAELEKPHRCFASGMAVATCRETICDCFGGSTWPQRAMEGEREARAAAAERDRLQAIVTEAALETYSPDGSERFVAEFHRVLGERDALREFRAEYLRMTRALEYGDDVSAPAATPSQLIDPLQQFISDASDHIECPVICERCGERLADEPCEHCNGPGCGPGTATGAYDPCEWCAGVGKVHPGCVEQTYADLAAERDDLRATVERVEALVGEWEADRGILSPDSRYTRDVLVREARAALAGGQDGGKS